MLTEADTPRSADWWLLRLGRQLRERSRRQLPFWRGYYTGDGQRLPAGPKGAAEAYMDFQKKSRTNFCALPVDARVARLVGIGLADSEGKALKQPWQAWWDGNKLAGRQRQVYRTAYSQSEAYVSVGRHPADDRRPLIVPEHPREVIVEVDPATGERVAALKCWWDTIDGVGRATVFLPEQIRHYRTKGVRTSSPRTVSWGAKSWEPKIPGEAEFREDNDLGLVPIVPFTYRPDVGEDPEPVFKRVIDIQDRINLGVLNRMTSERYSAFRQKWAAGVRFPRKRNPETGEPEIDPLTGMELVENPYVPDPGALWANENKDAKFGEFSQTDLLGYLKTYQTDVQTLLLLTSTPAYYLPDGLINVGTDTVMALDTQHVSAVQEDQDVFAESWEEVFEVAGRVAGSDVDFTTAQFRWRDARQLNPAVIADVGTKRRSMGYPLAMVAEDMGDPPDRVERLRTEAAAEQLFAGQGGPGAGQGQGGNQPRRDNGQRELPLHLNGRQPAGASA